MGFNNGYDAGWQDAINAVKYGKVPGLGPASGGGEAAPAFDAGVLEGYDVEKLLSVDDLSTYLATLSDEEIKGLVDGDPTSSLVLGWGDVRSFLSEHSAKLASIVVAVLDVAHDRGLFYTDE